MPDKNAIDDEMTCPRTPAILLDALIAIVPEFRDAWEAGEAPATFHEVMLRFTPVFGSRAQAIASNDLRSLGNLLSVAVARESPIENAVSTCLLEHLGQVKAWPVLGPYLSELARRKSRA